MGFIFVAEWEAGRWAGGGLISYEMFGCHKSVGKSVVILGSTGSIGRRTLDVIRSLGPRWKAVGLAAGSDWKQLSEQARSVGAKKVAIADRQYYQRLCESLADSDVEVLCGSEGICEVAGMEGGDFALCAISGFESLGPAITAIRSGKDVGLASKEALVVAGQIFLEEAKASGSRVVPVDSEHSAVFQSLQSGSEGEVAGITLTASGGPFLHWPADKVQDATLAEAMNHPTWSMGEKITIDSATMMNKALEIIEAHYLFDLPADRIKVVIHPESIVHSLVEFCDGAMIGQLSEPDMALPIQYALTWPVREKGITNTLDLAAIGRLTFIEPDRAKFPALDLGYLAVEQGGSVPAVLNAANEQAIECFVNGAISFGRIVELTGEVVSRHERLERPNMAQLVAVDRWARKEVLECLRR